MPSAMPTLEAFATPEGFTLYGVDMQAFVANLRRIGRADRDDFHPFHHCFIGQHLAQLVECPTIRQTPLRLLPWLLVSSLPDASQVLYRNCGADRLGAVDDTPANVVVHPGLESLFSARQPSQSTPSALCAFDLEISPNPGEPISYVFDLLPTPGIALAGYSDVGPAQIDPNHLFGAGRLGWSVFHLDVDVKLTIPVLAELRRCRLLPSELTSLIVANLDGHLLSTINSREADSPSLLLEAENPLIVVSRSRLESLNLSLFGFSSFAVSANPRASPDSQVCSQAKSLSKVSVDHRLDSGFARDFCGYLLVGVVASIAKCLKRRAQFSALLRDCLNLADYCQYLFHALIVSHVSETAAKAAYRFSSPC